MGTTEGTALTTLELPGGLANLRELSLARSPDLTVVDLAGCPALRRLVLDRCPRLASVVLPAPPAAANLEHISLADGAPTYAPPPSAIRCDPPKVMR